MNEMDITPLCRGPGGRPAEPDDAPSLGKSFRSVVTAPVGSRYAVPLDDLRGPAYLKLFALSPLELGEGFPQVLVQLLVGVSPRQRWENHTVLTEFLSGRPRNAKQQQVEKTA
jgi:hypothetical protein